MRSSQYFIFSPLVLAFVFVSCSGQAPAPLNPRIAIAGFDNQSTIADRWVRPLLSYSIARQLQAESTMAANVVQDAEGWRTLGVGRVISGHYRREGQGIRIHAEVTDPASTRTLGQFDEVVEEAKLLEASTRLVSKLLGINPSPLNYDFAQWKGFAETQVEGSPEAMSSFLARSPGFAPAYPILAELLLRGGKREEALALKQKFPSSADALSRAQLDYALAPDAASKLAALEALSKLRKGDPRLLAELATIASGQGKWDLAAAQYRELTKIEAGKLDWWNALGYAEANQGQLPAAVAALNEYQRLAPNEPNALDSLGEVNYMNRNFKEAAKFFDEQWRRYPAFQGGVGWRKAAFAHYYAGDVKSADLRFAEWRKQVLGNLAPSGQAFQQALWLARSGRAQQARALLEKEAAESSGERKAIAGLHLAMMQFGLEGKVPAMATIQGWNQELKDPQARNEFFVFALMVQPAANSAALKARIAAAVPQPQLAALRNELLAAGDILYSPVKPEKPKLFPLPNTIDTAVDALLLRWRLAVLP